ncbi:ASX homology domain-containing protein, partial [Microdochium bolleyi]
SCLSEKEKESIMELWPEKTKKRTGPTKKLRPDTAILANSNDFRIDVARYQEDLKNGRHDPDWIRAALVAHKARAAGKYDDYLAKEFVERWGMPMP